MKALEINTIESSELVEQSFRFWFSDHGHIRSPFPDYIRPELKRTATELFFQWSSNLKEEAKNEINEEIIAEKFEEIIFETASKLVKTEDERITILYPFLPRTGDVIGNEVQEPGKIVDRWIQKEKDHNFLWVKCEKDSDKTIWKTSFELPI